MCYVRCVVKRMQLASSIYIQSRRNHDNAQWDPRGPLLTKLVIMPFITKRKGFFLFLLYLVDDRL